MKPFDSGHEDLVHDVVYDFYGRYVATCSSDQHIKVFKADKETNKWELSDSWKAHDSSIVAIDWASPEFGRIIASVSYDKTLKIWEENPDQEECSGRRWNQLCILNDSQGALYDVKFAPPHLGLKLASIGNDGTLRIYEALEPSDLRAWTLTTEINILKVPPANNLQSDFGLSWCPSRFSPERLAVCVLDQAVIYEKVSKNNHGSNINDSSLNNNLSDNNDFAIADNDMDDSTTNGHEYGKTDDGTIFADEENLKIDDMDVDHIDNDNVTSQNNNNNNNSASNSNNSMNRYQIVAKLNGHHGLIRSISWAPSIGRWYQLIATGSKDGNVRIFKLTDRSSINNHLTNDNDSGEDMEKHTSTHNTNNNGKLRSNNTRLNVELLSEHDDHNGEVWSVSWNLTGTILSSAGDDGKVRLWKSTYSNEFKCMSVITAQQQ